MKYTYIISALILSLVLTGCFQKPGDTSEDTQNETPTQEIDNDTDENTEDDTMEDNETSDEDTEPLEDDNQEDVQVDASGSVNMEGEEEVVIEEIEAELEELFSDLLGEDGEK